MARSTKTRAEFEAMAMLLGLEYDARDHTFTMFGASGMMMVTEHLILCADTLKPVSITDFSYRQTKVKEGRLGPADDI
ncbi:hypothetical protein EVB41_037 [Rhizobium phage RHph_TM3_14A]|nr:hypothetical protein EVB29_037 [Rhizobium phage RHph_TM27A]QIG66957.1 hypothetical protein EVB30_037 [Rhizobium phage RHph_TM27B]QIG67502.1 hypothetical protein EVB41_037 [Rhizobium phage RHph_TM3_14A]